MPNDFDTNDAQHEAKRRAINEMAIDQYKKTGKLSGKDLLRENSELDGDLNKPLLEQRLARYQIEKV